MNASLSTSPAIARLLRPRSVAIVGASPTPGALGAAAAGLILLGEGHDRVALSADEGACIERQERPTPRLRVGRLVARTSAASAAASLGSVTIMCALRRAGAGPNSASVRCRCSACPLR